MEPVESHQFMSKSPQIISKMGRHMMGLNLRQDRKMISGFGLNQKFIFDPEENKLKNYIKLTMAKCMRMKTVYLMFGSLLMSIQPVTGITAASASSTNQADSQNSYVVKAGDTLISISKKKNTSIHQLKKLNNLTSDLIHIGQTLRIANGMPNYSTAEQLNSSTSDIQNQLHLLGYNYVPAMTGSTIRLSSKLLKLFKTIMDYLLPEVWTIQQKGPSIMP